jgi:hypothetical protein
MRPSRTVKNPQPRSPSGSRHSSATTSPASWIRFHDARHVGGSELPLEHRADGVAAFDRLLGHLMVDRVRMVEVRQAACVAGVEPLDPAFDDFARQHDPVSPARVVTRPNPH